MTSMRIAHIICLVISALFAVYAFSFGVGSLAEPGPGMWPTTGAVVMLISSVILCFKERDPGEYESSSKEGQKKFLLAILILAISSVIFVFLGMVCAILFMMITWLVVLGEEPIWMAISVSFLSIVGVYLVFVLGLGIPFPQDIVLNLLGL